MIVVELLVRMAIQQEQLVQFFMQALQKKEKEFTQILIVNKNRYIFLRRLGSLWIRDTVYSQKEIAKLVGYENKELISAISVGYTDETPKQRPRKELNEVLEWY